MFYDYNSIKIDAASETERVLHKLRNEVVVNFKKRGAVVGISGGIDSSVVLALCVRAFGQDKVHALMLPEKDSSADSLNLAKFLAEKLGVKYTVENLSEALAGFGCYQRRDEAVRRIFPDYNSSYKMKILLPKNDDKKKLNIFYIKIISPDGAEQTARLPLTEYLQITAASNFKQRSRMAMLYYYAESKNYAVVGTGNKNEHLQGFFVKHGDGAADIKPIAHLFKTQVYQLAEYLNIPEEIVKRTPTTDTYSAEQTQEEFFFKTPFDILDRIWYGWEKGFSSKDIAEPLNLSEAEVDVVISDIKQKILTTEYLRAESVSLNY
ncbi:NAD(+) synthase [Ignavibacterium sp.]|uniref:NAD(+) synthase n=1 Tax=Ignavibacterium sp. TaxID=2651167 RepID=UPI00307DB585